MPSTSKKQQRYMCADYGRAKSGKKTRTGMSQEKLKHYCSRRVSSRSSR